MSPLEIPLYEMGQNGNVMPENTLRRIIRFVTTVGLKSDSYFQEVHGALRAILTIPDPAELYISEELQCLALRGITSMILSVCYRDPDVDALGYVPLRSAFAYQPKCASSKTSPVYAAISAELANAENLDYCFHAAPPGTDPGRADRPTKFSYNQLPLEDAQTPQRTKWQRLDLASTVIETADIIETLLCENDELAAAAVAPEPRNGRPDGPFKIPALTQLQLEAVYSLVLLSDFLGNEKIAWLQDVFAHFFYVYAPTCATADPVFMSNLAYGILKSVAICGDPSPGAIKLVTDVVKYALESADATISTGALAGMRAIAAANEPKLLLPPQLIGMATKHILAELGRRPYSEQTVLHLLASGFSLVRAFPSETEMSGFFDGLMRSIRALVTTQDCHAAVVSAVFHGLCTLIMESSLPPRAQVSLESFSLKILRELPAHATNSQKGLCAFGLLLTSLYHAEDRSITDQDKAVRNLFDLARRGVLSRHVPVLVEAVARLAVDKLSQEVAVSLAVSEFMKSKMNARVTGLIVERVFSLVEDRGPCSNIVAASVRGILSCETTYKVWMATCLLLAATNVPLLHALFRDALASCKEDFALFSIAIAEFVADSPNLSKEAKENICTALDGLSSKVVSYDAIISKIKGDI